MLRLNLSEEPRAIREAKAEERELARQRERSLILRLLAKKIGVLEASTHDRVVMLSTEQLESLGEALLDFTSPSDLERWLTTQG